MKEGWDISWSVSSWESRGKMASDSADSCILWWNLGPREACSSNCSAALLHRSVWDKWHDFCLSFGCHDRKLEYSKFRSSAKSTRHSGFVVLDHWQNLQHPMCLLTILKTSHIISLLFPSVKAGLDIERKSEWSSVIIFMEWGASVKVVRMVPNFLFVVSCVPRALTITHCPSSTGQPGVIVPQTMAVENKYSEPLCCLSWCMELNREKQCFRHSNCQNGMSYRFFSNVE